ncbi:MAG: hypothetical protein FRX49_12700 [Trebouxia sp. A1-2]|nr:MAG: hypothetical protein FRX49_12700 [Trebouxia sp. A1-2]
MDSQLDAVRHRICKAEDEIVETKQELAAAKQAGNKGGAEEVKFLRGQLLSLNNQLSSLQEEKNILLRSQTPIEMVDCETNEPSIQPFIVPRNGRGQLDVEAIEKSLAASQHILEGIVHGDRHGYPACRDGWTCTSYTNTPIQLQVAPKPVRLSSGWQEASLNNYLAFACQVEG